MTFRTRWSALATLALATTAATAQAQMSGRMGGNAQGHDMTGAQMAAMSSMATMMQRAGGIVQHTQQMMSGAAAPGTPGAMPMDQGTGDHMQVMAGQLHAMATGLHGFLQRMDAMQKSGMKMDRDGERDWMTMHQRADTMLRDMEKTMQALDRLQKRPPQAHP